MQCTLKTTLVRVLTNTWKDYNYDATSLIAPNVLHTVIFLFRTFLMNPWFYILLLQFLTITMHISYP